MEQINISQNNNRRLDLPTHKEQQISSEEQLIGLRVGKPCGIRLHFDQCHQNRSSYPEGKHGIERRHRRSVICNRVDLLCRHLYRFCKEGAVILRITLQKLQQCIYFFIIFRTLQPFDQFRQLCAHIVNHGLDLLKALRRVTDRCLNSVKHHAHIIYCGI